MSLIEVTLLRLRPRSFVRGWERTLHTALHFLLSARLDQPVCPFPSFCSSFPLGDAKQIGKTGDSACGEEACRADPKALYSRP